VTLTEALPHLSGLLNAVIVALLLAGFVAIRRGRRELHPRLMLSAVAVGVVFLVCYGLQVGLVGHRRFPGDDWVRTLFLVILGTHTTLALTVPPLVLATLYFAWRRDGAKHRRLARITFPIWCYVASTGVLIYLFNNHLRPTG
jgi:putative membrane protein